MWTRDGRTSDGVPIVTELNPYEPGWHETTKEELDAYLEYWNGVGADD